MQPIFDFFFQQYENYALLFIILESIAVVFGFLSVWFSKQENIWVYPTGIISTAIFVYLLWKWELFGDMMINFYYTSMSIYGWYIWSRKDNKNQVIQVTKTTVKENIQSVFIFLFTMFFTWLVYNYYEKWDSWTAYVDTITTGIFFVGMWLMAKKKLENWIYWIVGDIISVPLYFYKGLTLTSLQYLIFTIIAIYGYRAWKRSLNNSHQIV
ncbi:MAG TPA: nicotinamide riboside transporter PnuC [Salinimicrobium sp.]|nr:nicotinamide riboside transporter PnuC [Salinimicrobium sp.]